MLNLRSLLAVAALLSFTPSILSAQQPPPRDPRAVAVLQQSLSAMGGTVPADSVGTGTVTIVEGSTTERGTIRILTRGTTQTAELIQTSEGDRSLVFSNGKGSGSRGQPAPLSPPGETRPQRPQSIEAGLAAKSALFPLAVLAEALANRDAAFEYLGDAQAGAVKQHQIRFWNSYASNPKLKDLAEVTRKEVWIEEGSGLPARLSYTLREARGENVPALPIEVSFSDYRRVGGILYAFHIEVTANGTLWRTIQIQEVKLNTGLTDADFPVQARPQ